MRAFLYADWIITRKTFLRYLLFTLIVVTPVIAMANGSDEFAPGVAAASVCVAMVTFYITIGLFSVDESNGWEQVRLTLPTSARQVVRSRYAFCALVMGAMVVVGTLAGVGVEWAIRMLHGVLTVPRGVVIIGLTALGASLVLMLLLAIEMPILFWKGITKARMAFSLPMMLPLLLTIEPVRNALMPLLDGLEALERSLGTPAPIFVGAAVAVFAIYAASMLLSERLYAGRDF